MASSKHEGIDLLQSLIHGARPEPPDTIDWFGRAIAIPDLYVGRREGLGQALANVIYTHFHCAGAPATVLRTVGESAAADSAFENSIATEFADARFERVRCGEVSGSSGAVHKNVDGVLCSDHDEPSPQLRRNIESHPGFVFINGSRDRFSAEDGGVRLYINLTPRGASTKSNAIIRLLEEHTDSFSLKFASSPSLYWRCDTCVIYLPSSLIAQRGKSQVTDLVSRIIKLVAHSTRRPTSPFTLRIADGLSLADSPPSGESFGKYCAASLANAIINCYQRFGPDYSVSNVQAILSVEGLSLDSPYALEGTSRLLDLRDTRQDWDSSPSFAIKNVGPVSRGRPREREKPKPPFVDEESR